MMMMILVEADVKPLDFGVHTAWHHSLSSVRVRRTMDREWWRWVVGTSTLCSLEFLNDWRVENYGLRVRVGHITVTVMVVRLVRARAASLHEHWVWMLVSRHATWANLMSADDELVWRVSMGIGDIFQWSAWFVVPFRTWWRRLYRRRRSICGMHHRLLSWS